jgi:hypothetical protein
MQERTLAKKIGRSRRMAHEKIHTRSHSRALLHFGLIFR